MQVQRRFSIPLFAASFVALMGCSPDDLPTSPARWRPEIRGALTNASALVAQAVAGRRVRGEQDDMLRREAALPGFGGFYIDSLERMVVYMKTGSKIPEALVRKVLGEAYSSRPEPRIQQLRPEIAKARIARGDFALSELIAIENQIAHSPVSIPGYTGVGTSLATNRVVVGFMDTAQVEAGLSAIITLGVPAKAVVAEVWGPIAVAASFDQANGVRPVRGGLRIGIHNMTQYPWVYAGMVGGYKFYTTQTATCSLNFNSRWRRPDNTYIDYMITAAHCVNGYRGINGVTGDTIFQPTFTSRGNADLIGFVDVNEPWNDSFCGTNPANGSVIHFCIDADAMLMRFNAGVTGERKLATSLYEGLNGNIGDMRINNWHPIQSVVTPEWIAQTPYGVHKSGAVTGTTNGVMELPVTQVVGRTCWATNCPTATNPTGGRQIWYMNVVKVRSAGWGEGDSGGVVFGGNGAPYYALGMIVAGGGKRSTDTKYCTAGTACSYFFTPWAAIEQSARNVLGNGTLNPITTQ